MSGMFFKNILITDVQQKRARFVSFEQGLNVITSSDNHVGKSSVVKALYHTLGAEVNTDPRWDKNTKLSAVTIDVDGTEYLIARFIKKFAVFKGKRLILLTDSVTKELAPLLGEIFDFAVYLAEKNGNKNVVQAPPVFSYLPYYIDQDKGWSELYNSFENIDQFLKSERSKSIYFHLGLYTKSRIDNQARKDRLRAEIEALKEQENNFLITIKAISSELYNLIPAENSEELEKHLETPKKEIESIVQTVGRVRNKIQELQTILHQHEYQMDIIQQYQKIKLSDVEEKKSIHVCPKCGYEFDDDLYTLVRNNYNQSNEEYLKAQIQLIISNVRAELQIQEERYVALMSKLKEQEKAYDESQNAYNAYIRHCGLAETLRKYRHDLTLNRNEQSDKETEIKDIDKEMKRVPDKKKTEGIYISFVKENLIKLGVWNQAYEGKIKLLRSINAQGSLMPKVILSQHISLYQTMNEIDSSVIRFPFVVDSPRSMEPSDSSSKEILNFIVKKVSLPQIIIATVDYDKFEVEDEGKAHKIFFDKKFSVLNEETYIERRDIIEGLYNLLTDK